MLKSKNLIQCMCEAVSIYRCINSMRIFRDGVSVSLSAMMDKCKFIAVSDGQGVLLLDMGALKADLHYLIALAKVINKLLTMKNASL